VRTAISHLKSTGEITCQPTRRYTLITVVKYDDYQSKEKRITHKAARGITKRQQSGNKAVTTNNNDNNDNNDNKKQVYSIPPTLEQLESYISEKGFSVDPQYFLDYYGAIGWMVGKHKMKDWKATVRNWERRQKDDSTRTRGSSDRAEKEINEYDEKLFGNE
jgi:hypothetical protein